MKRRDLILGNPIHGIAVNIAIDILNYVYDDDEIISATMIENVLDKRLGIDDMRIGDAKALLEEHRVFGKGVKRITENCVSFCDLFNIDEQFSYVLSFILAMNTHMGFRDFFFKAEFMDARWDIDATFADLAGLSVSDLQEAMQRLHRLHLLETYHLNGITGEELPPALQDALLHNTLTSKADLVERMVTLSEPAEFTLDQFSYVETDIVADYLSYASEQHCEGINILLHGPSGSGKTQLAKALAEYACLDAYDIRSRNQQSSGLVAELDSAHASKTRLQHLAMVSELLNPDDNVVLLIDECESLFHQSDDKYSKDTLHRLLEHNALPVIWTTNHVHCLEPSFIRRFKVVLDVQPPEGDSLLTIAKPHLKGLRLSKPFKQSLVQLDNITPAHIANAGHVAKVISHTGKQAENTVTQVIESSLDAAGLLERPMHYRGDMDFDMRLLNIKQSAAELATITDAVKSNASVRVLLTGPAGTGKTAFAHHLANIHQRKLKRITGSDVLSKYVGESEQHVAALFREAHRVGDMLLLDEVDSLLSSRDFAQATHEVQLVNELLAQMECFTQPLFAATNYEKRLDKAVLRRFDFKLECDYLSAHQVITLYQNVLALNHVPVVDKARLTALSRLTPGDFALLQRRKRFTPLSALRKQAIALLEVENNRKHSSNPIGFIAK